MNISIKTPLSIPLLCSSMFTLSNIASAYDCTTLSLYDANAQITLAEEVQHNSKAYRCNVEGWCNTGGWAYEPGVGEYWGTAWESLGNCESAVNGQTPEIIIGLIREKDMNNVNQVNFKAGSYDLNGDIVRWEFIIHQDINGELINPTVIAAEDVSATDKISMSHLWTWTDWGKYVFEVKVTDASGNQTTKSEPFEIKYYRSPFTVNSPEVILTGEQGTTKISGYSSGYPSSDYYVFATPELTVTRGSGFSASSSSSGGGTEWYYWQDYHWTANTPGKYLISASYSPQNTANAVVTEVNALPADGLPVIQVSQPDNLKLGQTIAIDVQALDRKGIISLDVSLNNIIQDPLISVDLGRFTLKHGRVNTYLWQVEEGTTSFQITTLDNEQNIVTETHDIVYHSGPCEGNNPSDINAYPNWPRLDWQGNPSHADEGDLMKYNNSVYRALWWTQATPGSNNAWEFVCEI
ncbi:cellulose-binding domain-containing protein [Teredinibacter sp. KSP-S5-2]|uniref:cellulose-binding domain-containing protein n=1 Tax=Teredinibacter sp. KSP-S5-2 TaxID=3034506 RepID=UPI002934B945|nr:cellulose-binding domain-containing protein [Teredinibacter sp. KSP-S5-2]WNO10765.1 cellulose-binding domain-containing protein [Teredinibacter sp. KSP-S5-2]